MRKSGHRRVWLHLGVALGLTAPWSIGQASASHGARVGAAMIASAAGRVQSSDQPLTYYELFRVQDLPGFPGGTPGRLDGASENGRFLWSHGAPADRYQDPGPAYLIIDDVYFSFDDFPALAGSEIIDINASGLVVATEAGSGASFVTALSDATDRVDLESLVDDVPADLDLTEATPVRLGDGGMLVLTVPGEGERTHVWGLLEGVAIHLWASESSGGGFDVAPDNTVVGWRYTFVAPDGFGAEFEGVRWTPESGAESLPSLRYVSAINSHGQILGETHGREVVVWDQGELRPVDGAVGAGAIDDYGRVISSEYMLPLYYVPWYSYAGVTVPLDGLGAGGGISVVTDSGLIRHVNLPGYSRPADPRDIVTAKAPRAVAGIDASGQAIVAFANVRDRLATLAVRDDGVVWGEGPGQRAPSFSQGTGAFVSRRDGSARVYVGSVGYTFDAELGRLEKHRGPFGATEQSAVFQSAEGLERYATMTDGELVLLYEAPSPFGVRTQRADLRVHLEARGRQHPVLVSGIDSFTSPWGAMNIVGLDEIGDLHAVWWSPGLGSPLWTTSNLSALTGASVLVGNVVGSATPWNGMQIMGTDERGHVIGVWWAPGAPGWRWSDLTAMTGGEPLEPGTLVGDATAWGTIELIGKTAADEIATYWWAPRSGGWVYESISAQLVGDAPPIAGPITMAIGLDGTHHIAGVSAEGAVVLLTWAPDGTNQWRATNLTREALRND